MPIGMSSGFWNPRAKGPLQIQNNGMPMNMNQNQPMNQPMNQNPMMSNPMPMNQNPMMQQIPGGMQPNYPPIAPSRNVLNRHMALPNPSNNTTPSLNAAPNISNARQRSGILSRRMF